jgi:Uma2 family endonuclease
MSNGAAKPVVLSWEVPTNDPRWVLDDDEARMPESPLQGEVCRLLMAVLERWVRRRNANALVGGHIALRWDAAHPRTGVDPDVYLIEPAPPLSRRDKSVRTWVKGHHPPRVAVEVVSESTADEDYHLKPAKYAASGTRELWVFDPLKLGPKADRCVLQVWKRLRRSGFRRVYAGDGPAFSEELGAWIVVTDEGVRLRIADDEEGRELWPTEGEAERAEKEAERAAKEVERAAKEAAQAEVERLRAQLAKLQGR